MRFNQYYGAFCANLLAISYGQYLGWTSTGLQLLQSSKTPLPVGPITDEQANLIVSVIFIGTAAGTVMFGLIAERYGRKTALYACAVPMMLFWLLLIMAKNVFYIYAARLFGGFCGGGIYLVIPLYVSEIAEIPIRGQLGTLLQVHVYFGIFLGYLWSAYFNYYVNAYLSLMFPILFLIGFSFVSETPEFLISNKRYDEAVDSLKFFRGYISDAAPITVAMQNELDILYLKSKEKQPKFSDLRRADFTNKAARRGILLIIIALFMTQASGHFVLGKYMAGAYQVMQSPLSTNTATILNGLLQFLGSLIAPVQVERMGRKKLLCASSLLTGIYLFIFGMYTLLRYKTSLDVASVAWFSILIVGALINQAWGIMTLPYVLGTELLPFKLRGIILIVGRLELALLGFIFHKFHCSLFSFLGIFGMHWFFAACCFAYFVYIDVCLPETKGLRIDEITQLLRK